MSSPHLTISPLYPANQGASTQHIPDTATPTEVAPKKTINSMMSSSELEKIELSRKREKAVSTIGIWEQIVQSYKTLLKCSEAQLISWRAELRTTEEKEMRLAERFPTPGALTAGANPTCQAADTFSGPNWATAIVAGAEKRLAHLAADDTAPRATLFRSIDDEKKVLAEMLELAAEASATGANGRVPKVQTPDMEMPPVFKEWITHLGTANGDGEVQADTSPDEDNSSHSRNPPEQTDKQPETPSEGEDYPTKDHRLTVRRGYGGYHRRGSSTRESRSRRGARGGSSRGATIPTGSSSDSVARPAGNLRSLKRPRTNDGVEGGKNSDGTSDDRPDNAPKHHKPDTPLHQTEGPSDPSQPDPPRQSSVATESEVFEISVEEPEGAMTFSRANISKTLGGTPLRTWVRTRQRRNASYKVDQYLCPMRERNPYLPTKPGDHGYIWGRQMAEAGQSYELFIPDDFKKWRYFGKYLISKVRKATLSEWVICPEADQTWWCKQILKEKWGLHMLLAGELITASEYNTCTLETVRGFFNRPDGEKNLRLNVLDLIPIGYNQEIYQALVKSLD